MFLNHTKKPDHANDLHVLCRFYVNITGNKFFFLKKGTSNNDNQDHNFLHLAFAYSSDSTIIPRSSL